MTMPRLIRGAAAMFSVVLARSAGSNLYDPGQRALAGGAIGAGAGAAIVVPPVAGMVPV